MRLLRRIVSWFTGPALLPANPDSLVFTFVHGGEPESFGIEVFDRRTGEKIERDVLWADIRAQRMGVFRHSIEKVAMETALMPVVDEISFPVGIRREGL